MAICTKSFGPKLSHLNISKIEKLVQFRKSLDRVASKAISQGRRVNK